MAGSKLAIDEQMANKKCQIVKIRKVRSQRIRQYQFNFLLRVEHELQRKS